MCLYLNVITKEINSELTCSILPCLSADCSVLFLLSFLHISELLVNVSLTDKIVVVLWPLKGWA